MANCLDQVPMEVTEEDALNMDIVCDVDDFGGETLLLPSLPTDMEPLEIFDYFNAFGTLLSLELGVRENDSFGLLKFEEAEANAKVLEMKHHTIDGREISVEIASYERDEDETTSDDDLPIEPSNLTGTELMDVNDDCLRTILAHVTSANLCSLHELSKARKNIRLKKIADETFRRQHNVCTLDNFVQSVDESQRLLANFGPLISRLTSTAPSSRTDRARLIKSIVQHCSGTLESLNLRNFYFDENEPKVVFPKLNTLDIKNCDFRRATDLFAHCESLVQLVVSHSCRSPAYEALLQHTFPKLELFCWDVKNMMNEISNSEIYENFILRHTNLKTIMLSTPYNVAMLPAIAANCSELSRLDTYNYNIEDPVEYGKAVRSVSSLKHLKELTLVGSLNALTFIEQLTHFQSLKCLTLNEVGCTPEIVSALTELKMLETLDIAECKGLRNFEPFAKLCRLKELSITALIKVDFNLVYMVTRLTDLEKLSLDFQNNYEIDKEMYNEVVNARSKAGSAHSTLEISCNGINTVFPGLQ